MAEQPKNKLEDLSENERELSPKEAEEVKGGMLSLKGTKPTIGVRSSDPCEGGE